MTPRASPTEASLVANLPLGEVIKILSDACFHTDEQVSGCGRRLHALCRDYDRVAKAASANALGAIASALSDKPALAIDLIPPLINLSAGDDAEGIARAGTLVELGVVRTLSSVLDAIVARTHDDKDEEGFAANDEEVARIAIWALQHLCRKMAPNAASTWFQHVLDGKLLDTVSVLMAAYPKSRALVQRGLEFAAATLHVSNETGDKGTGGASSSSPSHRGGAEVAISNDTCAAIVRACAAQLSEPLPPPEECNANDRIRHEAAAIALAQVCKRRPAVVAYAVETQAVRHLMTTLRSHPCTFAIVEVCCDALCILGAAADALAAVALCDAGSGAELVRIVRGEGGLDEMGWAGGVLQEKACRAMLAICGPLTSEDSTVRDRLVRDGATEAILSALRNQKGNQAVVAAAFEALAALVGGHDPGSARKTRLVMHPNALRILVQAIKKAGKGSMNEALGRRALCLLSFDSVSHAAALTAGANPTWIAQTPGAVSALADNAHQYL